MGRMRERALKLRADLNPGSNEPLFFSTWELDS